MQKIWKKRMMPDVAGEDCIPYLDEFEILGTEMEDWDGHSDESCEEDDMANELAEGRAKQRSKEPSQRQRKQEENSSAVGEKGNQHKLTRHSWICLFQLLLTKSRHRCNISSLLQ